MTDRLPDKMEQNARVEVRKDGTVIGTRRIINFLSSGSDADDSVNDIVSVVMGGGTDLWTFDTSVPGDHILYPTTTPDEFLAIITDGSDVDLAPGASGGDLNIRLGEDMNVDAVRDINLSAGSGIGPFSASTLAGDVNIFADDGTGTSHGDVNITGSRDASIGGVRATNIGTKAGFQDYAGSHTTLGSVIGRVPIYNGLGTLIGYIPIYDTIT